MKITGITPLNQRGLVAGFVCTPVGGTVELTQAQPTAEIVIRVANPLVPVAIQLQHLKYSESYYTELAPHVHQYAHSHNAGSVIGWSGQSADHLHGITGSQDGPYVNMSSGGGASSRGTTNQDTNHTHSYVHAPGSSTNTTIAITGKGGGSVSPTSSYRNYLDSFAIDIWDTAIWTDISAIIQARSGITFASVAFRDPGTKWVNISDLITASRVTNKMVKFRLRYPGAANVGGQIQYRIS
jgi:hypothetical protein